MAAGMDQEQSSSNGHQALDAFILVAVVFVALASVIALVEWGMGSLRLARLGQDLVPVAPATAICYLLLCALLLVRRLRPEAGYLAALHWLLAGTVMAAGAVILAEFVIDTLAGFDLDLERLLVREMRHPEGFVVGRMSPLTASLFILLSISVFSSFMAGRRRKRVLFLVSQSTATTVSTTACLLLVGYWYGAPLLYGGAVTPVALTTSFGLLALGAVLLVETPRAWLRAWLSSTSVAARFTRLTVPVTIILILLAGWVHSRFAFAGGTIDFSLIALVTAGTVALLTVAAARRIQATVTAAEQSLRERQEFAEGLIESSAVWIWRTDTELRHTYTNSFVTSRLGYRPEEFLAFDTMELIHPDDRDLMRVIVREAVSAKQGWSGKVLRWRHKDGGWRHIETSGAPLFDAAGAFTGMQGVDRDVTERIQAEEALRESESKFRTLFDMSTDGIFILDMEGNFIDVNRTAHERLGYAKEEMLAISVSELDPPEFAARVPERLAQIREHGQAIFESAHTRKDGSVMPVEVNSRVIEYRGEPALFSVIRDITERKRAEEALRESESKFRRLFDLLSDGIFILDMEGGFIDVNRTAHERLGYTKEEMLARRVSDIVPPEIGARTPERIRQIRENGQAIFESAHIRKDGSAMPVEVNARLIDYYGKPSMFSVIRDITERKLAGEEQERLREQLARAQRMESVGRLAGGVAHDFNNMLGVIMGHAEIAKARFDPSDPTFHDLEEVYNAAQRSADLTRQLLAFARRQATSPRVIRLDETVGSMLGMLRRMIGEEIELELEAAPDLWLVRIDPSQVDQIMANLLVNARDAIEGAGKISMSIDNSEVDEATAAGKVGFAAGEYVRISVSDDGRGIDPEILDHVFEPFFTTKGMAEGTGLGLSTVYGIVKQNDGYINVESVPGEGTTFEIYLPRYTGAPEEGGSTAATGTVGGEGETVMLVEDEPTVLKMTETMLRRLGYKVITAPGPSEAINLAREHSGAIDVLVTDVVMPEMSGRQLADQVAEIMPGIGCLFMSGYTADVISDHGVIDDDVSFLQKPFTAQQLAGMLRDVLRRKGQAGRA
ncbi:MAG: PAS domain S-box protein [Gaiellales bacterium]|nr:MAG: PAS domain S-box protein [Gaiellales bacterium]